MLTTAGIDQFAHTLQGRLIGPDDPEYDNGRAVWNGMVDRRPALIAQCAGAEGVVQSIAFAREAGLETSVRGGGHGVAGNAVADGGLMVDLSPMNAVQVDPKTRTARVGAGATWGDFDGAAQVHGLATTGGTDSRTGVAGLTLGGGLGFLGRKYGLAADNLVAADVVTADGRMIRSSADEHADLFWALRGGGGNFGVVTAFEFQLHEVGPEVLVAQVFHPFEDARDVLRFYRDFMVGAPDEVTCLAVVLRVPPVEPFPEPQHGTTTVALVACYAGEPSDGAAVLEPLGRTGDPFLSVVQPMPYTVLQQSFDAGFPDGERYYWKSSFLGGLTNEAIDAMVTALDPLQGTLSAAAIESLGGAIGRVGQTETAFPHRDAAFNFSVFAGWSDPAADDDMITWTRETHRAMTPFSTGDVYANYLSQEGDERVRAAYGENYARLRKIKAKYDPDNAFHLNQNIPPTG